MSNSVFPFLDDLVARLGDQVDMVLSRSEREVYLRLGDADIRPAIGILREEQNARVAMVFAEDRRSEENCFLNHYVIEFPGNAAYLVISARVDPDNPTFPSLSAEMPALNWQEREIQDWFGIQLEGHPNPRRVALHDNWPDVHPLRKDFPIETVLPPFEGERHVYRPASGRGRLSNTGRTCPRRYHRTRPLQFRGGGRADPVSATAHVLHAQGHGEAVRGPAGSPRGVPG